MDISRLGKVVQPYQEIGRGYFVSLTLQTSKSKLCTTTNDDHSGRVWSGQLTEGLQIGLQEWSPTPWSPLPAIPWAAKGCEPLCTPVSRGHLLLKFRLEGSRAAFLTPPHYYGTYPAIRMNIRLPYRPFYFGKRLVKANVVRVKVKIIQIWL